MSDKDNVTIARRTWDAWNAHDVDAWIKLLDDKSVLEGDGLPGTLKGREAARPFMQMYLKAFPDLHFTVDQMLASGDYVITRYTGSGTHKGDLSGIAPTGRRAEVHGCTIMEVQKGKIVHQWLYWDNAHLLRQLGVLPGAK